MEALRNYFLILLLFVFSNNITGQKDLDDFQENRDSTWGLDFDFRDLDPAKVNMKQLEGKLTRISKYNDSMLTVVRTRNIKERSDSLEQLYDLMSNEGSENYNAYTFFGGQYHSNLTGINQGLASARWPQLKNKSFHFTNLLDFTWKRGHHINDVYFALGNDVTIISGDVSITYNYRSFLNYTYGYSVIDVKRFQLFPYAGLSYHISNLTFENTAQQLFEPGKNIYDTLLKAAISNKRGIEYKFTKRDLVFNYGLELDYHIIYSKRKTGLIVGARAGGIQSIFNAKWQISGKKYPQIKNLNIKDYYFDIVIRVYARNASSGKFYLKKNWWENDRE